MELKWTKLIVAILFGLLRLFAGLLPIKIHSLLKLWEEQDGGQKLLNEKRHRQVECWLSLFQSFGGGVLLATCLLHMIPEVGRSVEDINEAYNISSKYPLAELLVCLGFFLLYFTEEFAHWMISRLPDEPCDNAVARKDNKVHPAENGIVKNSFDVGGTNPFDEEVEKEDAPIEEVLKPVEGDDEKTTIEVIPNEEKPKIIFLERDNEENVTGQLQHFLQTEVKTQQQILRCIFIVLALSLHSIFEGLAIGLQNSVSTIWYLFTAVSIHSFTILFCIGLELLLAQTRPWVIFGHILVLAIMSPIGIILGMLITLNSSSQETVKSNAVVFLEALSSGTILYITFFEVLSREKAREGYKIIRSICLLGGFLFMASLEVIEI